jgi:adenylate cyclase
MGSLLETLSDLHYIHDEQLLFSFVLNKSSEVLKAQGGTFFSYKEESGDLYPEAVKGVSLSLIREIPFKIKQGVAGWVVTNKKPAVIENAQNDDRFNRAVDVITGIRTRSLLCAPVIRKDKVMGVIELVNRVDGVFREQDMEYLKHLCIQVSVALENCRLYKQMNELLGYTNSVINSLSGGFLSTDLKGVITRCNGAASRILGVTPEEVVGKSIVKALPQYPAFAAILEVTQKHQTAVSRQEIELQKPDGNPILIGYSTFLVRSDTQTMGSGLIFQDITNFKRK